MKNTIKKFGLYASLVGGIIFVGSHYINLGVDFGTLEILGFASIFASLSFVFFGIKHFRDKINNGHIAFGKAILIGIAISAIASLAIAILDVIYLLYINPEFMVEYGTYALDKMQQTMTADEFVIAKEKFSKQMELYDSPTFAGLIMFMTVFAIGIVVSLFSSLILQRKEN